MDTIPDLPSSFENAACGLVTTQANGKILRANATFCKSLGFSSDELIGTKKIQELFTVGGRFFHHTHWAPLLQLQGSVEEIQMDLVARDGKHVPMLINGVRQTHNATSFDQLAFFITTDRKNYELELLSSRKSAQEALASLRTTQKDLQESRDSLSAAIRSARMGIWTQDLETGEVSWSPELQQLIGLTEKKHWGTAKDFYNLIHPDDRSIFGANLQNAIHTKSEYEMEFRLQDSVGNWLAMSGRGHATYNEAGDAISVFGVVVDISERKATELQLTELNQRLSSADRRKDEFLATLAHELRNPLAPMRNVLEVMRLKETDDSFLRWSREMIDRHVSQMTHLVDDLMEVTRISHGRLELRKQKINILDAMQNAIESSHGLMQKSNHIFTVKKPETPIFIEADSTRIVQVISNLLTNAAKYTPDGGNICLRVFLDGNEVVVSVVDSGIGMPPEQLSNVFNMFSQLTPALERSQGGLGIGLALVHGLVTLHGGTITAYSDGEGKGSEFIVRLPVSASSKKSAPISEASTAEPADSKRILVIEDNVDAAESLSLLLDLNGHTTRIAFTGTSGFELAEEFNPEVILLDIGLPDINGYRVAELIRQKAWGQNMFLIALTGWGQDKDKELARDAGFDKHLTKPIDYQELNSLIQKFVL